MEYLRFGFFVWVVVVVIFFNMRPQLTSKRSLWLVYTIVTLTSSTAWLTLYTAFIFVPIVAFTSTYLICLVAKKSPLGWALLYTSGMMAPWMISWPLTATPDQLKSYGAFPLFPAVWFPLVPSLLASGIVALKLKSSRKSA